MKNENANTVTPIPDANVQREQTIVKLGKINYIIKESFAEKGKEVDELLEQLVVKKIQQTA